MTDLSAAIARIDTLERDDFLHYDILAGGLGIVAYFGSDRGLRAHGQSSLVHRSPTQIGLLIAADGSIPRDAEAQEMYVRANKTSRRSDD